MISNQQKEQAPQEQVEAPSSVDNLRKRRSKNHENGRDFICECGKSYLSYSALYTHAKVKHGNKITYEQSLYTTVQSVKPPPYNFIDPQLLQKLENDEKQYSLTFLANLLHTARRELRDEYIRLANPKKLKLPNEIFIQQMKKYWENRGIDDEVFDGTAYVTSIDNAIGYLLIQLEAKLKNEDFAFMQMFIMKLKKELNEVKNNWKYTETTLINNFPKDMNQVFTVKFKGPIDFFKENPTLNFMLIYHICSWLYSQSLTNYQLRLNLIEVP